MAATTTIEDNGASLKITVSSVVRNITKSQIVEISVIRTNIIKIDIRMGALHNIYIPFGDVTSPATGNPAALRDYINSMLPSSAGGGSSGGATEAKQTEEINLLNNINTAIGTVNTAIGAVNTGIGAVNTGIGNVNSGIGTVVSLTQTIDRKLFYEPLLVDDGGAGIIYKGYAMPGSLSEAPVWAIQKIERREGVDTYMWANGNKDFSNTWAERESLSYI